MSSRPERDPYRHPLAQGPSRSHFRKSFDLFALGCVLYEIALWKSLQDIFSSSLMSLDSQALKENSVTTSKWAQINSAKAQLLAEKQESDLSELADHAGDSFKEVILLCLHAPDDDPEDEDLQIRGIIVKRLQECKV